MPQNELAVVPQQTMADIERLAEAVAKSGMFGIKNKDAALVLMAISQAEGRHPALAARDYDIINGQPAKKAEAVLRDFLNAGGSVKWHTLDDTIADATFSHPTGGTIRIDWTLERAAKAGLAGKDTYKKFPRAMLRARCISEGVKSIWPAATSGMYTPEEQADIPIRDAQPAPLSAAADLDQFAAEPLPLDEKPKPRDFIWQRESFHVEPELNDDGEPDLEKWKKRIVFLINEGDEDEIKKLRADNRARLNQMRLNDGDLYREIVLAAEARQADLNAGAAA